MDDSKNVLDRIRKLLLNYDLEILTTQNYCTMFEAKIKTYMNDSRKAKLNKLTEFRIRYERQKTYLDYLLKARENLTKNIKIILEKYVDPNSEIIFTRVLIHQEDKIKVARELGITMKSINVIINDLEYDILDYYFPYDCRMQPIRH